MRCQDYRKYLSPYLDSELDARISADIAEHLSVCEACSKHFVQELEVERRLVKGCQREKMPEEAWRAVLERLSAYDSAKRHRVRLAWLVPAAVVPVAAMVLVWVFIWGKTPDADVLAKPLLEAHGKYIRQEIAIGQGLLWPQGFEELAIIKNLPQSGPIGGHAVQLKGSQPCYIKGIKGAHVMYSCCNTPVSIFILRKEDMGSFKGARRLLDKGKGYAVVTFGDMRLTMIDLKEAVVCCISSHEDNALLTAFEHI